MLNCLLCYKIAVSSNETFKVFRNLCSVNSGNVNNGQKIIVYRSVHVPMFKKNNDI